MPSSSLSTLPLICTPLTASAGRSSYRLLLTPRIQPASNVLRQCQLLYFDRRPRNGNIVKSGYLAQQSETSACAQPATLEDVGVRADQQLLLGMGGGHS
jgi:hypothetical protein